MKSKQWLWSFVIFVSVIAPIKACLGPNYKSSFKGLQSRGFWILLELPLELNQTIDLFSKLNYNIKGGCYPILNKFRFSMYINTNFYKYIWFWPYMLSKLLNLTGCTELTLHPKKFVVCNGNEIGPNLKLDWFKILCENDWNNRFRNLRNQLKTRSHVPSKTK
jgi:hypothetical protein